MANDAYTQAINNALSSAKSMLGKNEVPNHEEIQSYLRDGGQDLDPHKVAWCAAFVSASLQKAGLPVPTQVVKDSAFGPGAYAPNYLSYGSAVDPKGIQAGDILVANDGHHVGFAEGPMRNGPNGPEVQLLAGNERDASGQYAPGSYTSPTGSVANRAQVGMVGERWVPLSQYTARRYQPTDTQDGSQPAAAATPAPSQPSGTTINSTPAAAPGAPNSNIIETMARNIAGIESGGYKNPYEALGPVVPGGRGRAIGKYQVMPENVPGWTLAALGHSMTPDEFKASPDAQEAVIRDQLQRGLQLYGPKDVASIYFTGKPFNVAGGGASDRYTTNASYAARATAGIPDGGNAPASSAAPLPAPSALARPITLTPTQAPGPMDPTAQAGGPGAPLGTPGSTVNPPIPTTPGTTINSNPMASLGGKIGDLAGNLQKDLGKSDEQAKPDIKPLEAPPAPPARNVSPLLGNPQLYAQRMAALNQPMTWGGGPPGQMYGAGYGPQNQPVYGTSLMSQLQMLSDPTWMNQMAGG